MKEKEYNSTSLAFKSDDYIDLPLDTSVLTLGEPEVEYNPEDGADSQAAGATDNGRAGSISDALIRCLRDTGRVDIERIAEYAGTTTGKVIYELSMQGAIYQNPNKWNGDVCEGWETADEYLSGNLYEKLNRARVVSRAYGGSFQANIKALEALLPQEVKSEDIYVTLGSPWIPTDIIDDFINHLIQPHSYHKYKGTRHDEETGSWEIPEKYRLSKYVRNTTTFGTPRMNAINILERTLNMKTILIKDEVSAPGTKSGTRRELNKGETAAAQEKQKLITAEFRRWIWQDEERAKRVRRLFANKFGYNVARQFNGSYLEFPGMSEDVELYKYQKDAVARILFTPNTLLAHDVGAGKTYIMIAAAMEMRRMGMAKKSMFVVPNNLVEQWRSLFLTLYPEADVLCVNPKDMNPERRNQTLRRVMSSDCDGIIIAYSCFDRIPLSKQAHIDALKAERDEMESIMKVRKTVTGRFKRKLDKLKEELSEMALSKDPARDIICFNQLGIDRLFVDEAHNYKNVSVSTSIYGVYGISQNGSAKCNSMLDKVHYVQNTHNGGGVVMATGTPITNSISDIYVFQQYLQSGELNLIGLSTFDSWVGMFAEKTTEFEIAVDTNSYRLATRFSHFHNIPELTTILASIADFHAAGEEGDLPDFDGYQDVLIPRTDALKAYLEDISERADKVHNHKVKTDEDNMLKITGDGRKAALDIRLTLDPAGDAGCGAFAYGKPIGICKVTECAERAAIIYHKTEADRLTQLIFCDTSTPKAEFNVYDDLRQRLVNLGVDPAEIAYIHDAGTEAKRKKLFKSMREGKIRILIGSTFKLGLGVNVQDRLVALHHLDLPWRPADMVQREGRILRTGNMNQKVEIYRYITEGSFDAYSWQLLETKQRFIADILSGTIEGRSGSEVDDTVLNYAEVKALALGNPLLKSRVEKRNELTRLSILQRKNIENRLRLEQRYKELPDIIAAKQLELDICTSDCAFLEEQGKDIYAGLSGWAKENMAAYRRSVREYLGEHLYRYIMRTEDRPLYNYRGFTIVLPAGMSAEHPYLCLVREGCYKVDMSDKEAGILIRIDNFLDKMDDYVARVRREKEVLEQELAETETELAEMVNYADEIDEVTAELAEVDEILGVNEMKKTK